MLTIPASRTDVLSPNAIAALLWIALPHLRALELADVTSSQVLTALSATRSRVYVLKARLEEFLDTLVGPSGRPSKPAPMPAPPSLATDLLRYVAAHPGSIRRNAERHDYSDGFRRAVLDLREQHPDVTLEAFAEATTVPLGTLKDWLRVDVAPEQDLEEGPERPVLSPVGPQLQTLLAEWKRWDGTFAGFCDYIQKQCSLPFKRHHIATILEASGVRLPARRAGRSPDEVALRGAFATWFPHAQWVGDGSHICITIDGEVFAFNLELNVDAYSGAFVGADVSDVEDSDAVIATFRNAAAATGARPIALLLDNKPCNHTDDVLVELGKGTILIPATAFRPQNKAHVEGAFGLLKPTLEGLMLDASGSRRDLARSFLKNLVVAVARTINHRPQRGRGRRSRASLLDDRPSPEQIEEAKRALQELVEKQRKARETLAARQDPVVRDYIAAAFVGLGLNDPRGTFLTAIARYPLDAVVDGCATFEAKQRIGTLPDGVDARYLLGIVRNIANDREGCALAEALWEGRAAAKDMLAAQFERHRDQISATTAEPRDRLEAFIDQAMQAISRIDRYFWLNAAASLITDHVDVGLARGLYRLATRRIAATYALRPSDRTDAIRLLANKVIPLA